MLVHIVNFEKSIIGINCFKSFEPEAYPFNNLISHLNNNYLNKSSFITKNNNYLNKDKSRNTFKINNNFSNNSKGIDNNSISNTTYNRNMPDRINFFNSLNSFRKKSIITNNDNSFYSNDINILEIIAKYSFLFDKEEYVILCPCCKNNYNIGDINYIAINFEALKVKHISIKNLRNISNLLITYIGYNTPLFEKEASNFKGKSMFYIQRKFSFNYSDYFIIDHNLNNYFEKQKSISKIHIEKKTYSYFLNMHLNGASISYENSNDKDFNKNKNLLFKKSNKSKNIKRFMNTSDNSLFKITNKKLICNNKSVNNSSISSFKTINIGNYLKNNINANKTSKIYKINSLNSNKDLDISSRMSLFSKRNKSCENVKKKKNCNLYFQDNSVIINNELNINKCDNILLYKYKTINNTIDSNSNIVTNLKKNNKDKIIKSNSTTNDILINGVFELVNTCDDNSKNTYQYTTKCNKLKQKNSLNNKSINYFELNKKSELKNNEYNCFTCKSKIKVSIENDSLYLNNNINKSSLDNNDLSPIILHKTKGINYCSVLKYELIKIIDNNKCYKEVFKNKDYSTEDKNLLKYLSNQTTNNKYNLDENECLKCFKKLDVCIIMIKIHLRDAEKLTINTENNNLLICKSCNFEIKYYIFKMMHH